MRKAVIILAIFLTLIFSHNCFAGTDDAGVLAGLENNDNLFGYLNMYNYRTWLTDHRYSKHDMYISQDDSVIVSLYNDMLDAIYILKSGYKTNKGIEVGMTLNDIKYTYGPIYNWSDTSKTFEIGGFMVGYGRDKYTGYYAVEYESPKNEGLTFIIDKYTSIIAMIRYQKDRHGNTMALGDLETYHFLPYKK